MEQLTTQQLQPLLKSFLEYVDRPARTTQTYLTDLRAFFAWLSYAGIVHPERRDIIAFRQWLLTEHDAIQLDPVSGWRWRLNKHGRRYTVTCSPGTAAQYLRTVRQFFRWADYTGLYADIAKDVRAPRQAPGHRKEALRAEDVRAIEAQIQKGEPGTSATKNPQAAEEQRRRLYALYLLAVNAGLRCVEMSRANRRDLELRSGSAWLYVQGKGHAEADQRIALAPEVYAAIRNYLDIRTDSSPALFVATGNRSGGRRLSSISISLQLKAALRSAGYDSDRITAHSLRHTAGTCVQAMTRDLYATQHYMRHVNPATTEIYLHLDNDRRNAEIAASLYKFYHPEEE